MYIGISITIILILLGLFVKKNKLIFFLQGLWIWLLTAFNCGGIDYDNNRAIFLASGNSIKLGNTGYCDYLLSVFWHEMNWQYASYSIFLSTIAVLLILYIVKNCTRYVCVPLSFFMSTLLVDSVIQKRFYIAMCFVLLALYNRYKSNKVGFVIALVLALGFHFSVFMYFLLPLMEILIDKSGKKYIGMYILAEFLVFKYLPTIIGKLPLGTIAVKLNDYMSQSYTLAVTGLLFVLVQGMLCIFIMYIEKYWKDETGDINHYIMKNNRISLLFLPLLLIGGTFSRYFRVFQFFDFSLIANCQSKQYKRKTMSYYLSHAFIILMIASTLVLQLKGEYGIRAYYETVFLYNTVLDIFN